MVIIIIVILTDEEFHKFKKIDPVIFEKVYNGCKKKIYNFILIKTRGNHHVAGDLLNETFCSAITSAPKLKSASNIEGWLIRIASRRYIDHVKKFFREKKYLEIEGRKQQEAFPEDMVEKLHQKEKVLLLNIAIDSLKPEHSKVLKMKCFEEKKVKEIAQIINKSPKAVENILYKARLALKDKMIKLMKEYER